jgi:hypothetical protein
MVWLALLIVFGIVIGNIMLIKHTAHMKMPSLKQRHLDELEKQKQQQSDDQP